jgi:RNA polymerase sigma-70 factor
MDKDRASRSEDSKPWHPAQMLSADRAELVEWLYARANASRWALSREHFAAALERSMGKSLASGALRPSNLEEFLGALHLEDLALASACAEGCEAAWEHFYAVYRSYLHSAAAAILRRDRGAPEASELADSLFAELYGLARGKGAERSLFRYFHGRSSLKTWLRAVLAQRHVDAIRAGRRFEELGDDDDPVRRGRTPPAPQPGPIDPHRQRYLALFSRALGAALEQLDPQEKERLRLYYAEEATLAEIGRLLGEHESSASRHLDRARRDLRQDVENRLRAGFAAANGSASERGLGDAEITLCFQYCAEDSPIDLEKLLPPRKPRGPAAGKRPS